MEPEQIRQESPEWDRIFQTIYKVSGMPREIWNRAEGLYSFRKLEYGDFFVKQGKVPTEFAFVFSGQLREYYLTDQGDEYIKSFCFPGEFTGSYFDLLSEHPSTCNIRALSDCLLGVANFADFTALYEEHPAWERLGRKTAEFLFIKKAKREYELLALSAEQRYESLKKAYPKIEESIPQYHIASYLGITPVSLSRIRSKLSKAGS
nr:Crp/Fnr family transcriptional regulator [Leptospira fluminis]